MADHHDLNDIWDTRRKRHWNQYSRAELKKEGLDPRIKLYWNSVTRVLAWVVYRSKPGSERFKGNFSIDRKTLQYLVRAKHAKPGARQTYVGLMNKADDDEVFYQETASRVMSACEDYPPFERPDESKYWWCGEDLQPTQLQKEGTSRGLKDKKPPFFGKGLADDDDDDENGE